MTRNATCAAAYSITHNNNGSAHPSKDQHATCCVVNPYIRLNVGVDWGAQYSTHLISSEVQQATCAGTKVLEFVAGMEESTKTDFKEEVVREKREKEESSSKKKVFLVEIQSNLLLLVVDD
jgi:hypothetical protein